jgi:hypothetical protein
MLLELCRLPLPEGRGHLLRAGAPSFVLSASTPSAEGQPDQAAYALFLFLRDICEDDLVGWIDQRLAAADPGTEAPDRGKRMGAALLEPLSQIYGIGSKVWSMAWPTSSSELIRAGSDGSRPGRRWS